MYKLGTMQGLLKGVYSRNQFEPLPELWLLASDVSQETEIALRSAANKQSQGGGQGFVKCGCIKTCQSNNCKCKKIINIVIPDVIKVVNVVLIMNE